MHGRLTPLLRPVAVLVALAAILVWVAASPAASPRGPALTISHASARIRTVTVRSRGRSTSETELVASFHVSRGGRTPSPRWVAWVGLVAGPRADAVRAKSLAPLPGGGSRTVSVRQRLTPGRIARLDWAIEVCAVPGTTVRGRPAAADCRRLGRYDRAPRPVTAPSLATTTTTSAAPPPTTTAAPPAPISTVPPAPVSYSPDNWFFEADGLGQYENTANSVSEEEAAEGQAGFYTSGYWVDVPSSYDASNADPETLLVWMHGCGGLAENDVWHLSSEYTTDRPYILISLNGPEDGNAGQGPDCWNTTNPATDDVSKVLTDIASVETHFNIDRRRVIIGGYSSGGDLAYETIFTHADTFAGILAINTDPVAQNSFDDNIDAAIAGAAWKFPIVQVSHASDTTYPPATIVGPHMSDLQAAGFPVQYSVLPGDHYDADAPAGCDDVTPPTQQATCTSGTYYDIAHSLEPHIASDGWEAPTS